ncbi:MAG: glycosyl hydrolase family 8 [Pseudomonadota bacterium]
MFKVHSKKAACAMICALGFQLGTAGETNANPSFSNPRALTVPTSLAPHEWQAFTDRFVAGDGRVIDVEKQGVSHSESQAYGMLLAVKADDQATFDQILDFTFRKMRGRGDGLISWLYNPRAFPQIVDRNNATDGDVIVAYALVKAALKWDEPRYVRLATPLIEAIGRHLLKDEGEHVIVRPAAFGFGRQHHTDGPVVNLSYYIYDALHLFAHLNDRYPFAQAFESGLELTATAMARSGGYAPDWITLRRDRRYRPAHGFAKKSSYDAVRIPLYMALGGRVSAEHFVPFDRAWNVDGNRAPQDFDLHAGRVIMDMNDPGYRAIAALAACAARNVPMPPSLQRFRPTTYFGSALHLMALSAARVSFPHCVQGAPHRGAPVAGLPPAMNVVAGSAPPRRPLTLDDMPGLGGRPLAPPPRTVAQSAHFVMR